MHTLTAGVNFESWKASLIAIIVINAVGVCGAGHVAGAGAATSTVAIVTH